MQIENLFDDLIKNLNQTTDDKEKFILLENIITLESEEKIEYKGLLYKDIKEWLRLYIKVNQDKNYGYDYIIFDKVKQKIELVPLEQRISLIGFFIRLLNKEFFIEEIIMYENYRKELELEVLKSEKKYLFYFIKICTKDLPSLLKTLAMSIIIFAFICIGLNCFFPKLFNIEIVKFIDNIVINYSLNIIYILFGFDDTKLKTIPELFLISGIKLYFYIMITYFLVKEISRKINSI